MSFRSSVYSLITGLCLAGAGMLTHYTLRHHSVPEQNIPLIGFTDGSSDVALKKEVRDILDEIYAKYLKAFRTLEPVVVYAPNDPRGTYREGVHGKFRNNAITFCNLDCALSDVVNTPTERLDSFDTRTSLLERVNKYAESGNHSAALKTFSQMAIAPTDSLDVIVFFTPSTTSTIELSPRLVVDRSLKGILVHEIAHCLLGDSPRKEYDLVNDFFDMNKAYEQAHKTTTDPQRIPYEHWVSQYAEFGDAEATDVNISSTMNILRSCNEESDDMTLARDRITYLLRKTVVIEDLAETLSYVLLDEPYALPSGTSRTKVQLLRKFLRSF